MRVAGRKRRKEGEAKGAKQVPSSTYFSSVWGAQTTGIPTSRISPLEHVLLDQTEKKKK